MLNYSYRTVLVVFIAALLAQVSTAQQITPQPVQRCGEEISSQLSNTFWGNTPNGFAQIALDGNTRESTRALSATADVIQFDVQMLQDGAALAVLENASLSSRLDDPKTLSIFTPDGQVLTLPENQKPSSLYWWRLLPESAPGQFSIFGYDTERNAFLVEVYWSSEGIRIGEPRYLPFTFSPMNPYRTTLSISPSLDYISFLRITVPGQQEFFIYSVTENRYIWQTPYDNDTSSVRIAWVEQGEMLGFVSGITRDMKDQWITIDRNGQTSDVLVDLSNTFGEGVFIYPSSGAVISPTQLAFILTIPASRTYRPLILDLVEQQVVDLCYSTESTGQIIDVTDDGNITLYQSDTRQLVNISTQTGDYSITTLPSDIQILQGTFR